MTEWHIRYGSRGVMIYWHVEKKSVCIYSQRKRCSSSEAAAMIEEVLRHCTEAVPPPELGPVRQRPEVGSLHPHDERIAAGEHFPDILCFKRLQVVGKEWGSWLLELCWGEANAKMAV